VTLSSLGVGCTAAAAVDGYLSGGEIGGGRCACTGGVGAEESVVIDLDANHVVDGVELLATRHVEP